MTGPSTVCVLAEFHAAIGRASFNGSQFRLIHVLLAETYGRDVDIVFIGYKALAALADLDPREARRSLASLVEQGVLLKTEGSVNGWQVEVRPGRWLLKEKAPREDNSPPRRGESPPKRDIFPPPAAAQRTPAHARSTNRLINNTINAADRLTDRNAHEDGGGGVHDPSIVSRLRDATFNEKQIRDVMAACGARLTHEILDRWAAAILNPPAGVDNPTGVMYSRLSSGTLDVLKPARSPFAAPPVQRREIERIDLPIDEAVVARKQERLDQLAAMREKYRQPAS